MQANQLPTYNMDQIERDARALRAQMMRDGSRALFGWIKTRLHLRPQVKVQAA